MNLDYNLNIDFKQLNGQKKQILELMEQNNSKVFKIHSDKTIDAFEGILNLMDNIQDQAVDVHGMSEEEVFGFTREPNINEDMSGEWITIKT